MTPSLVNITTIRQVLGNVSERTIHNWKKEKIIPYIKVRGVLLFSPEECVKSLGLFRLAAKHEEVSHA